MSQIVLYFLHSTSGRSFYIDVVLNLFYSREVDALSGLQWHTGESQGLILETIWSWFFSDHCSRSFDQVHRYGSRSEHKNKKTNTLLIFKYWKKASVDMLSTELTRFCQLCILLWGSNDECTLMALSDYSRCSTWWRHHTETLFPLLDLCEGIHRWRETQRSVAWSFDVFFDVRLNERLNKPWSYCWFRTSCRSCDVTLMTTQIGTCHVWCVCVCSS